MRAPRSRAGLRCTRNWRCGIRLPRRASIRNDAQRIQRALEVLELSGRTLDEHWQAQQRNVGIWRLEFLLAGNAITEQLLHRRIAQRLDAMLACGISQTKSVNCWRAAR